MPRFYFDIDDGTNTSNDDEGLEKATAEEAGKDLVVTLAQLAKDRLSAGNVRDFIGTMRGDDGTVLFNATLSLRTGWAVQTADDRVSS